MRQSAIGTSSTDVTCQWQGHHVLTSSCLCQVGVKRCVDQPERAVEGLVCFMGAHKDGAAVAMCTIPAQEAVGDVDLGIMQAQSTCTAQQHPLATSLLARPGTLKSTAGPTDGLVNVDQGRCMR